MSKTRVSPRRWLNYAEAATYTGLSERQLRRAVPQGHVPHVKLPGSNRVLFDPEALDSWLVDNTHIPESMKK